MTGQRTIRMDGMAAGNGVLRDHLARRARAAPSAAMPVPASPPAPARMAATAAAQAARAVAGLAMVCADSRTGTCSLAELPEHLPEHPLLAIVEGGIDRLGVIALSPGLASALIEMQALGRLAAAAPEMRRPTRADAALAADFIDGMLAGLGTGQVPEAASLMGFRYASHLADPRPLALMLEDRGFRTLRLDLRLGPMGEREGVIFLALPLPADTPRLAAPAADAPPAPASVAEAPAPAAPRRTLAAAMRAAPVALNAILCRRRITLAELRALAPGAMLALPRQALAEARLEAADGRLLASGKLGEADGFHALRLYAPQSARTGHGRPPVAEPPIGDLAQPDAFRSTPDSEEGLRNWQEALAEGRQSG